MNTIIGLAVDIEMELGVIDDFITHALLFNEVSTPESTKRVIEGNTNLGILCYGQDFVDGIFMGRDESIAKKSRYARYADDNKHNPFFGNAARITWIMSQLDPLGDFNSHNVIKSSGRIPESVYKKVGLLIDEHEKLEEKISLELPNDHPFETYPECHKNFYLLCLTKYYFEVIDFGRKVKEVFEEILGHIKY